MGAALAASVGLIVVRPAGAATTATVTMQHYMYMPTTLGVTVGDTVTWVNEDDAPHTVTGTAGPEHLDSPSMGKGDSWSYTFGAPGTYSYYCVVHPDMRATITVAV